MEKNSIVKKMAAKTGVSEADVAKVLKQLGLNRFYGQAIKQNGGAEPALGQAKLMFRVAKNSVVM
jgi:hypothetical protein